MECLAELKALAYFLRLGRPNVFDLIRDHNLFTVVKDQALLLVEFDQQLEKRRKLEAGSETAERSGADEKGKGKKETSKVIALLVDHTYSIPIARVAQQLHVPLPIFGCSIR
ncbi:Vacuolar protein sorting-associated protein 41 [Tulasnella sp. 418]|nr:Vacuolar protein sorting-associated protein 41 [Tulasnella sp. 418]